MMDQTAPTLGGYSALRTVPAVLDVQPLGLNVRRVGDERLTLLQPPMDAHLQPVGAPLATSPDPPACPTPKLYRYKRPVLV